MKSKVNKQWAKDDLWLLHHSEKDISHNSFFNNRKKSMYESELSALLIKYSELFLPILDKISQIVLPDIKQVLMECNIPNSNSISSKLHRHFTKFEDFNLLLNSKLISDNQKFYEKIINFLQSNDPDDLYMKLCIHRAYIVFFTEKGLAKPVLNQAVEEQWSKKVDLNKLVTDTVKYRSTLFAGNLRNDRRRICEEEQISTDIGILPPESILGQGLKGQLPKHKKGILKYLITTNGYFTNSGMHVYDMPQACGPSGMIAMRLALANQACLSEDEKQLYDFAISLYTIAIGGHTIDECFIVGTDDGYSKYIRGNYESIVPEIIKTNGIFSALWENIQQLNNKYSELDFGITPCQ